MKKKKQTTASALAAGFVIFAAFACQAEASASQLSLAQTIMGAQASPEIKLDALYIGATALMEITDRLGR